MKSVFVMILAALFSQVAFAETYELDCSPGKDGNAYIHGLVTIDSEAHTDGRIYLKGSNLQVYLMRPDKTTFLARKNVNVSGTRQGDTKLVLIPSSRDENLDLIIIDTEAQSSVEYQGQRYYTTCHPAVD